MLRKLFLTTLLVTIIGACGNKESETTLWEKAQEYEKQENFAEALKVYETQLREYPQGEFKEKALHKLAFLNYNNVHDFAKAIEYHRRLVRNYPESELVPQALFMIGYINANDLKDYDAAKMAYEEFLQKHSDNELAESVRWELDHLGQDVNEQLQELFGNERSNGESTVK